MVDQRRQICGHLFGTEPCAQPRSTDAYHLSAAIRASFDALAVAGFATSGTGQGVGLVGHQYLSRYDVHELIKGIA
jgi:hypothetical protein